MEEGNKVGDNSVLSFLSTWPIEAYFTLLKQTGRFSEWISLVARLTCSSISQDRCQKMFSPAEDQAVKDWARRYQKKWYPYAKKMWVEAEREKITPHSGQAMKTRYRELSFPSTTATATTTATTTITTASTTASAVSFFITPMRDNTTQTPDSHNPTHSPTPTADRATFSTLPIIIQAWCSTPPPTRDHSTQTIHFIDLS